MGKSLSSQRRDEIIDKLKNRFPGNNPASWGRCSNTQLLEWEQEYLVREENEKHDNSNSN